MFRLELDLVLYFVPPFEELGPGIVLTRSIELPFAPYAKLSVYSKEMDEAPEPFGFTLKEVIWDMDRQVFLSKTVMVNHDVPMAEIPDEIAAWIGRGWRWGSWMDAYQVPDEPEDEGESPVEEGVVDDWDEMEKWPSMSPRKRPAQFNKLFRAIVRTMAALYNNSETAYAMDKTQQFFSEEELKNGESAAARRFTDARYEFSKMSLEAQVAWRTRILRKYPPLDRFVS